MSGWLFTRPVPPSTLRGKSAKDWTFGLNEVCDQQRLVVSDKLRQEVADGFRQVIGLGNCVGREDEISAFAGAGSKLRLVVLTASQRRIGRAASRR